MAAIKKLTISGLPLRSDDENLVNIHNGNFLMILYLSEFDPVVKEQFCKHGNKGSGSTSTYLKRSKKNSL